MPVDLARPEDERYFDHIGSLGLGDVHPFGAAATARLLAALQARPGERLLELGCGTGTTLARLAARPGHRLIGLDRSLGMLRAARLRLRLSPVLSPTRLVRGDVGRLPFVDGAFDGVYAESVVAFQEEERIGRLLAETRRVLRPGGRFVLNEAIWRPGISQDRASRIHAEGVLHFGTFQTGERARDAEGWRALFATAGFEVGEDQSLETALDTTPVARSPSCLANWALALRRMRLGLRSEVRAERRRYREATRLVEPHGAAIEARLFLLRR